MSDKRERLIVAEHDARVFFVRVGELWEEDASEWASRLFEAGQKVRSVRKVMHDTRGVMRVEFTEPTDMNEACHLLEAKAGVKGSPVEGRRYRLTKEASLRPAQSKTETPLKATESTVLVFTGKSPDQYIFDVKGGDHDGRSVSVSQEEWEELSSSLKLEPKKDTEEPSDEESEQDAEESEPEQDDDKKTKSKEPEDADKEEKRLNTHLRVRRSFPDFPQRNNLADYLTPNGKELDQKKIERPEGGGRGGGGFGGF